MSKKFWILFSVMTLSLFGKITLTSELNLYDMTQYIHEQSEINKTAYLALLPARFPIKKEIEMIVHRPFINHSFTSCKFEMTPEGKISHFRPGSASDKKVIAPLLIEDDKQFSFSSSDFILAEECIADFQIEGESFCQIHFCPNSIFAQDETGEITVIAVIRYANPTLYQIFVSKEAEAQKCVLSGIHLGKKFSQMVTKEEPMIFTPSLKEKKGGYSVFTLKTKEEKLEINLPWGDELSFLKKEKLIIGFFK